MYSDHKPTGYVDPEYLQAAGNHLIKIKQRSYTRMQIEPGHKVLDLGCGPGTDTIPLAPLVGVNGLVIGADYDAAMIAEADKLAREAGVSTWVRHERVDATEMPFKSNHFDACRSDRLFQHLPDPGQAMAELVRVTKPGGWIVVLDTDWGSLSIDSDETGIERKLARFMAESFLNNGYSGRRLYRLFKQQNLLDVTFEVFPNASTHYSIARKAIEGGRNEQEALKAGAITSEELQRWRAGLERADSEGRFFCSVNTVMLTGRRPL